MSAPHQSSGFFITGTDTEVGKTLVSGALILKLKEIGLNTTGFKPVAAGTYRDSNGRILNEDIETLSIASYLGQNSVDLCPFTLKAAIAPHLAAQAEGIHLNTAVIVQAFQKISASFDAVVAEGAGGFLVPLNEQENLADVAKMLKLPIILVVGMRLGCINHALLTWEALTIRKLPIAGWIANTLSEEMPHLSDNIQTLKTRINAPLLGIVPPLPKNLQKQANQPYSLKALEFAAGHIKLPA